MKKKILIITKYFPPEHGGIESLVKNICDVLSKNDQFEIDVLCFSKFESCIKNFENYKVFKFKESIKIFSTPISFKFIKFIIMNMHKYNIVHIFTPNPLPSFLFAFFKTKKLLVSWGSDIINQKILKFFFKPFQYFLLKKSYKIICLSSTYRDSSDDLKSFLPKISIIPPLCKNNLDYIKKKFEKNYINILSIGRLVDYKNYETSILSLKFLPEYYNLTIIGDGKNKKYLESLINNNFLNNRVKILTNINDKEKNDFFFKSDIYLQSSNSRAESFGISILEALSNSMPLVISNVEGSGMNDMVIDGFNGFKFQKNNPSDCASKVLLINEKNFENLRKNSYKLFNDKFNQNIISEKLMSIYD